jgi:EAL and modified HD-GYP domain-containing signal transduction protein
LTGAERILRAHPEESSAEPACPFCIGRQPIYDAARRIRGYELLYRRLPTDTEAVVLNPDQASADVLLKAFLELGLPRLSPAQPVFVNCTKTLLGFDPILPPESCVLEVLEDVPADPETFQALERLKSLGYRIALDDFAIDDSRWSLVSLADHVKVDVRLASPGDLCELVGRLRRFPVTLLAEKIETRREFDDFRECGYELFQGYFLHRPETLTGKRIPSNRLSVLALVAECLDPALSLPAVAAAIGRDASLTYGLLKLANSALFGGRCLRTLEGAVVALGIDRIYRWSMLMVLADLSDGPQGYLEFALHRARACELIAAVREEPRYEAYMVGILSALDSILDIPLEAVVRSLPLDALIREAILSHAGPLGAILHAVLAYEDGRFETAARLGMPLPAIQQAFWEAADYSATMLAGLSISQSKAR